MTLRTLRPITAVLLALVGCVSAAVAAKLTDTPTDGVPIDRMTGDCEQRTTYPSFSRHPDGSLLFKYRDGGSGDGSDLYNIYDPDTRTWRRLFEGPLLDGEGERSAYGTGPKRGPDGLYHMLWMWRDTPDAMSRITLCPTPAAGIW